MKDAVQVKAKRARGYTVHGYVEALSEYIIGNTFNLTLALQAINISSPIHYKLKRGGRVDPSTVKKLEKAGLKISVTYDE